jgi:hypothetical protein
MLALINQQQGYTSGQGLVNPTLYTLAANSTTYASAFHDITTGNNNCTAGTSFCSSTTGFAAGTAYDQATGLGTIDLYNLANAWPANTGPALIGSNTAPTINVADNFTITVTSSSGATVPTGTVALTIDGGTPTSGISLTSNGTATYSTPFATTGTHVVVAAYSGDSTHAVSTGTVSVNVAGTTSRGGTFALAATNITVAQGKSGTSTITITPAGGYTGTVDLSFDTSNDNSLANLCWAFTNTSTSGVGTASITSAAAVTTSLTLDTNASDCSTGAAQRTGGKQPLHMLRGVNTSRNSGTNPVPGAAAFAGLLLAGFLGRYSRKFRATAGVIALVAVGLAISGCNSVSGGVSNPPKGTYTITVTGQDSSSATIPSATTKFTFVIQ